MQCQSCHSMLGHFASCETEQMFHVEHSLHKTDYGPQKRYTVREWVALLQAAS